MKEKEMVLKYIETMIGLLDDSYSKTALKLVRNFILKDNEKKKKILNELKEGI